MPATQYPDGDPNSPSGQQRTRLEEEVLEILQRTDQPISFSDHVRRKVAQERRQRLGRWQDGVASLPSRLSGFSGLVGCLILAFLAFLVRDLSPLLATILAVASVVCLLLPIVQRFRGPTSPSGQRWRGQDVSFSGSPGGQPAWFEHLRQRFRRPPRI
jgi:hypothetical protein